jgi:hypothetical protein
VQIYSSELKVGVTIVPSYLFNKNQDKVTALIYLVNPPKVQILGNENKKINIVLKKK